MCKKPDFSTAPVEVRMRRSTNLDLPKRPALPAHLALRCAKIEEAGALAALCGRAYVTEIWEPEGTERELFHDNSVRAILVVADNERLLATASIQVNPDAPNSGQLRWVATELEWRRQGLAKALVISLLDIAKKAGCEEIHLRTTSDQLGAITMYLQLGFEPVKTSEFDRDIWKKVFSLLNGGSYL